jgi:hypothetical protein
MRSELWVCVSEGWGLEAGMRGTWEGESDSNDLIVVFAERFHPLMVVSVEVSYSTPAYRLLLGGCEPLFGARATALSAHWRLLCLFMFSPGVHKVSASVSRSWAPCRKICDINSWFLDQNLNEGKLRSWTRNNTAFQKDRRTLVLPKMKLAPR